MVVCVWEGVGVIGNYISRENPPSVNSQKDRCRHSGSFLWARFAKCTIEEEKCLLGVCLFFTFAKLKLSRKMVTTQSSMFETESDHKSEQVQWFWPKVADNPTLHSCSRNVILFSLLKRKQLSGGLHQQCWGGSEKRDFHATFNILNSNKEIMHIGYSSTVTECLGLGLFLLRKQDCWRFQHQE